jgi:hypothetical protein
MHPSDSPSHPPICCPLSTDTYHLPATWNRPSALCQTEDAPRETVSPGAGPLHHPCRGPRRRRGPVRSPSTEHHRGPASIWYVDQTSHPPPSRHRPISWRHCIRPRILSNWRESNLTLGLSASLIPRTSSGTRDTSTTSLLRPSTPLPHEVNSVAKPGQWF